MQVLALQNFQSLRPTFLTPMQTLTHPSAPAKHAPSQAISASKGAATPCIRTYTWSIDMFNRLEAADGGGGKSKGIWDER